MMTVTIKEIEKFCQHEAMKWWGLKFNVPVVINGRLTSTLARYSSWGNRFTNEVIPRKIEISKRAITHCKLETIRGIMLHELTHWALSVKKIPFSDGDYEFEKELKRVNAPSTGVLKYSGELYKLKCSKCNDALGEVKSKIIANKNVKNYVSNCCHAKVVYDISVIKDMN